MKSIIPFLVLLASLISTTGFASDYFADAKNLVKFKSLYLINQEKVKSLSDSSQPVAAKSIDLNEEATREKLAKLVLGQTGETPPTVNTGTRSSNAFGFSSAGASVPASTPASSISSDFDDHLVKKVKKEIDWYVRLVNSDCAIFEGSKIKEDFKACPPAMEYLERTIITLEKSTGAGGFTSMGLGSLVGVSQADILKGIADWALSRAQEELMQAFLREWLNKIQSDSIMMTAFPNTLNMLETSELTTIFTDGDTWKETFMQDFDELPNRIPSVADAALNVAGNPLDARSKNEMLAGLEVMSDLFGELGKGKKPDEILLLLGEESYLRSVDPGVSMKPIIDRSMVGMSVFLKSLIIDNSKFVTPHEIYEMSEAELKMYWCLIYLCERNKLKIAFNLPDQKEADFYNDVLTNSRKFKVRISRISESINGISSAIENAQLSDSRKFNAEQFHNYVLMVFDLAEAGFDIIGELSPVSPLSGEIDHYKQNYLLGYRYVARIHEGIKEKKYGKVALNFLNIIIWINDIAKNHGKYSPEKYETLAKFERQIDQLPEMATGAQVAELIAEIESVYESHTARQPQTNKMFKMKVKDFKNDFTEGQSVSKTEIQNKVTERFQFTREERELIVTELTELLPNTSESVNKYSKLMAGIILADDSEDIKSVLENAAMKTGGYLVRQKSAWSASMTFYPGFEAGREKLSLESNQLPNSKTSSATGSYMGISLPIGIEVAKGTNWRPIGAIGLFVQILDIGAFLNYSLNSSSDSVSALPEIGFRQVLSPGSYLTVHLANNPITFGGGFSFSPDLRMIRQGSAEFASNAVQWGAFVAVDLNVFSLYASKKKYGLTSQSFRKAYEN